MNIKQNIHPRENQMTVKEAAREEARVTEIQERRAKAIVRWREAIENLNRGGRLRPAFINAQKATIETAETQITRFNELLVAA